MNENPIMIDKTDTPRTAADGAADGTETGDFLGLSRRLKWLLFVFGWTAVGLTQGIRHLVTFNNPGRQLLTWSSALTWGLAEWYIWGLLSPLIVGITTRIGVHRDRWVRCLVLHLCGVLTICIIQILFYTFAFDSIRQGYNLQMLTQVDNFLDMFAWAVRSRLHSAVLIYSIIAFFGYAIDYYRRYHSRAQRLVQVRAQLTQTKLEALKTQLRPEFLFETLDAITGLIPTNPEGADLMIARLSELLRTALDDEGIQQVSLQKELVLLDYYLEIQKIRFGDRLQINKEIAPETLDAQVPSLVLEPLVDIAVRHGILQHTYQAIVRITAARENESLRLTVTIESPEYSGDISIDQSGGNVLENIHRRLRQIHGKSYQLELRGMTVYIVIPFQTAVDR